MATYEIRILKHSGAHSLVYACEHFTDQAAIRAGQKISRAEGERIEIWQGMRCVHREDGLARTG